ncbi:Serine/threonine-protein phosphatase 4 regulatory subunit 2 [Orchesella cincta]|uniref:Serine/threonine-protein phosphatase 4 regulatory subunit 2 n=1 Tax=Orchesella cincta TaxID=48709 RepID=A0A1D2N4F6_ORCCI|nr:Serine/threonine-protein phosphatase 4 regulatory subunit 2 [Orchesella cincta]
MGEFNTSIGSNKPIDIPQTLDNYLQFVARSGNTVFPWPHVRSLFRTKMLNAIQQFQEPSCPTEGFVLERFDLFRLAAPFTVQRLTELILQPTRHYRKKEKFLRGLEKTVLVVSTVEPRSLTNDEDKNGNDNINTSASSGEGEIENVAFSRTFSLDRQDIVASPLRSSVVDVINPSVSVNVKSDSVVVDAVTSSAVSSATVNVDILNSNIAVALPPDVVISESVTSSNAASVDVITPDIAITVSSESIILDPTSEVTAAGLVSIAPEEVAAVTMECESSTTITEVAEVSPVSLLQCVSDHDLVPVATVLHQTEPVPLSDAATSVPEDVSSSLVNMDAVKLPLDESGTTSMDCQSSSVIESEDQAAHLFHCVAVVDSEDPMSVTTPLQATDVVITEDPLLLQTKVTATVAAEPIFEDVPASSLVNMDAVKPEENTEQKSLASTGSSAMECESTDDVVVAVPQPTPVEDSLPVPEAKEEFQIVTGTEAARSIIESKPGEQEAATVVLKQEVEGALLNPETEKSSGEPAVVESISEEGSDKGTRNDDDDKGEAMDEAQQL